MILLRVPFKTYSQVEMVEAGEDASQHEESLMDIPRRTPN